MLFAPPLIAVTFLKRYKRFLADVKLPDGSIVTAHCPNPGAMLGLLEPGAPAWVSAAPPGSKRKLLYTLEIMTEEGTLVGANTQRPNQLVAEALAQHKIAPLRQYTHLRPEVTRGDSRVDFLLTDSDGKECMLEVKNVHLKQGEIAAFPDCPTMRGVKHLRNLIALKKQGMRACLLYVVQREDCAAFTIAANIDPLYNKIMQAAQLQGVEFLCYQCQVSPQGIIITTPLPIRASKDSC